MAENFDFVINHSKDEDYSRQDNNLRAGLVACFPTSCWNAAYGVGYKVPKMRKKASRYNQAEDIYDEYIHSKEIIEWAKSGASKDAKWGFENGIDLREIWDVEVYAFNKFIGKENACELKTIKGAKEFYELLRKGRTFVVGGKFAGLSHMVALVGCRGFYKDLKTKDVDVDRLEFIIDDSFGDFRKKYRPIGVGGNNVPVKADELLSMLRGDRVKGTTMAVQFNKA